jgi:hypothetical protein
MRPADMPVAVGRSILEVAGLVPEAARQAGAVSSVSAGRECAKASQRRRLVAVFLLWLALWVAGGTFGPAQYHPAPADAPSYHEHETGMN